MWTYVNDRILTYNLWPAYAGRMSHTLAYVEKFCACTTIFDDLAVLRRIPACFSVLLTYTKLTHNLFDVRQRIRQIFIRRHMAKSSRCDSAIRRWRRLNHFPLKCDTCMNQDYTPYLCSLTFPIYHCDNKFNCYKLLSLFHVP